MFGNSKVYKFDSHRHQHKILKTAAAVSLTKWVQVALSRLASKTNVCSHKAGYQLALFTENFPV